MVFDENISNTVSLHRILDHFLECGEKPGVILPFLKMHQDSLVDIFTFSDCHPRMFSLDFAGRMTQDENAEFIDILNKTGSSPNLTVNLGRLLECFRLQMLMSTDADRDLVWLYRDKLVEPPAMAAGRTWRRYLYQCRPYDSALSSFDCCPEYYAYIVNRMKPEYLAKYAKYGPQNSLFFHRIVQADVFSLLTPVAQFVLLNNLPQTLPLNIIYGIKQIICGNFDREVKRAAYGHLLSKNDFFCDDTWVMELATKLSKTFPAFVDEMDSTSSRFPRFMMKLGISGKDIESDWMIFILLAVRGLEYFRNCPETCKSFIKDYCDISDLVFDS